MSTISKKEIESLSNCIKCTDTSPEHELEIFCYVKCDDNDSDVIRACRGVVFNGDKVVMHSFPYTPEYIECPNIDLEECIVRDSYEGVLIRMFYHGGKWWRCTTRKLDAYKSKWSSRESFGSIFDDALNAMLSNINTEDTKTYFESWLDKTKQYIFLITNVESNRIVCTPSDVPRVFHVGTYVNDKLDLNDRVKHIPQPTKHSFETTEGLMKYVDCISPYELQGVVVFHPDGIFKVVNSEYHSLFELRGNEPSIKFRYLQVRNDPSSVERLIKLYPSSVSSFEQYEDTINGLVEELYGLYVERFIRKDRQVVAKDKYSVILECFKFHRETRNNVTRDKIKEVLDSRSAVTLNRMIRAQLTA
jgi:hypothetical protein